MTKYFIFPVLFATITMACSTSTTTQAGECTTPECLDDEGAAGSTSVGGSDASGGSSVANGTGGNSASTGGNSGTTPTGTGGGTVVTTTATGGTTTTTCVPKTCADVAPAWNATSTLSKPTACGTTTDGCGGILSCGDCPNGTANTGCGQAPGITTIDWSAVGLVPVPNVCGSRCVKNAGGASTSDCATGKEAWLCPSSLPPIGLNGCTTLFTNAWCCNAA